MRSIPRPFRILLLTLVMAVFFSACATLPDPKFKAYDFPEGKAFVEGQPSRRFKVVGPVRVRVNYSSLHPERDEQQLCRNAFNKGANDLFKRAHRELKADGVIEVRSVVYYMDGKLKTYATPECADDGGEGQILMEGKAIRFIKDRRKLPKEGAKDLEKES